MSTMPDEFRWPATVTALPCKERDGRYTITRDRDGAEFFLKPVEVHGAPQVGSQGDLVEPCGWGKRPPLGGPVRHFYF